LLQTHEAFINRLGRTYDALGLYFLFRHLIHNFDDIEYIIKNIAIGTISSFLTFFVIAQLHRLSLSLFGFTEIVQISSLPLLVLWGALIGLIQTPISNFISRKFEYEADEYAVSSTNKTESFINTLEKLTDQNLGDREPLPIVEWFFYSHPSIKNRIAAIQLFTSHLQK
jgi:STE24 endopeptidase